jgi:hypothetical protein
MHDAVRFPVNDDRLDYRQTDGHVGRDRHISRNIRGLHTAHHGHQPTQKGQGEAEVEDPPQNMAS